MKLSIGGKVFIAGEYLVLKKEEALVMSLGPSYTLTVSPSIKSDCKSELRGIHADSPAGKLWQTLPECERPGLWTFRDPHASGAVPAGGRGASSAQYALVYAACHWREKITVCAQPELDYHHLLRSYRRDSRLGESEGAEPSGADLLGQVVGGLTQVHTGLGRISKFAWPFYSLDLVVFKTPLKVATHEHLKKLDMSFNEEVLEKPFQMVLQSLIQKDPSLFTTGISDYHEAMVKLNLVLPECQNWVGQLKDIPGVLSVKACGALGADLILAVVKENQKEDCIRIAKDLNLHFWGGIKDWAQGLSAGALAGESPSGEFLR